MAKDILSTQTFLAQWGIDLQGKWPMLAMRVSVGLNKAYEVIMNFKLLLKSHTAIITLL